MPLTHCRSIGLWVAVSLMGVACRGPGSIRFSSEPRGAFSPGGERDASSTQEKDDNKRPLEEGEGISGYRFGSPLLIVATENAGTISISGSAQAVIAGRDSRLEEGRICLQLLSQREFVLAMAGVQGITSEIVSTSAAHADGSFIVEAVNVREGMGIAILTLGRVCLPTIERARIQDRSQTLFYRLGSAQPFAGSPAFEKSHFPDPVFELVQYDMSSAEVPARVPVDLAFYAPNQGLVGAFYESGNSDNAYTLNSLTALPAGTSWGVVGLRAPLANVSTPFEIRLLSRDGEQLLAASSRPLKVAGVDLASSVSESVPSGQVYMTQFSAAQAALFAEIGFDLTPLDGGIIALNQRQPVTADQNYTLQAPFSIGLAAGSPPLHYECRIFLEGADGARHVIERRYFRMLAP